MRLWSIHPKYLDSKGLVALWRETLLAQKVLQGKTRGYQHHPQLWRFRQTRNPEGAIARYLRSILSEAEQRNYHFDATKISAKTLRGQLPVTSGQLAFEWQHLTQKLKLREPQRWQMQKEIGKIELHPLFVEISGDVEHWEVVT